MPPTAFRPPAATDAAAIYRAAPAHGTPLQDSCYAFILLCTHFADHGIVAEQGGEVVGYALGFRPPSRQGEIFIWHLGVGPGQSRGELIPRLLEETRSRRANRDAKYLCMTVNPSDRALQDELQAVARRLGARCSVEPCFPASLFAEPHADESLFRIGPLP